MCSSRQQWYSTLIQVAQGVALTEESWRDPLSLKGFPFFSNPIFYWLSDATYEPWSKWSACMSKGGKEVKCGYCKKTRTRKCKKTVLDQIQTLKDPHAIQKAETMLCQKKEITWTSYEYVNYHNFIGQNCWPRLVGLGPLIQFHREPVLGHNIRVYTILTFLNWYYERNYKSAIIFGMNIAGIDKRFLRVINFTNQR